MWSKAVFEEQVKRFGVSTRTIPYFGLPLFTFALNRLCI